MRICVCTVSRVVGLVRASLGLTSSNPGNARELAELRAKKGLSTNGMAQAGSACVHEAYRG